MGRFLLRRLANYLVLVLVATTLAYFVASIALNPRARYDGRNPPVPPAVIDQQLSAYGVNDKDPLIGRYVDWIGGVVTGDFGKTVTGGDINAQLGARSLVSLRLLVLGSILGAMLRGPRRSGQRGEAIQSSPTSSSPAFSFFFIATPVFFTAVLLKFGALQLNDVAGTTLLYYTGYETPGLDAGFWGTLKDQVAHLILPTLVDHPRAGRVLLAGTSATRCSTSWAATSCGRPRPRGSPDGGRCTSTACGRR